MNTKENKERRGDAIYRFKYVTGNDLEEEVPEDVEAALRKLSASDIESLADYVQDGDIAELAFEDPA